MASGLMNIGASGLQAAYQLLQITGQNIANVNTPGYHRQDAVTATIPSTAVGDGYAGGGVNVPVIQRRFDQFLTAEANLQTSQVFADRARSENVSRLDKMFSDPQSGIGAAIDSMNQSIGDLSARPADPSARAAVLQRAEGLASRVRSIESDLSQMSARTDQRIVAETEKLNLLISTVADLNKKMGQYGGTGQPSNEMLDQRDQMVSQINELIRTNAYINSDGTVSLFSTGGQALVSSGTYAKFNTQPDPLDGSKIQVTLNSRDSSIPVDANLVGGGSISGLLRFRDDDLANARLRVGQLAGALAGAFNGQQAKGLDATGATGGDMFSATAPRAFPATSNSGNGQLQVSVADASKLAASDYEVTWTGGAWQVKRVPAGDIASTGTLPTTVDGLNIASQSGTPAAGDRFLVRSASTMARDFSMVLSSGSRIATGSPVVAVPGVNTGDAKAKISLYNAGDVNLTAPVTISFGPTANEYSVSGPAGTQTGLPYIPGQPIAMNGWSMSLTGKPNVGDSFRVGANPSPGTDNTNAKAMVGLVDAKTVNGATFNDAYAEFLADVGLRGQNAELNRTFSEQSFSYAKAANDEVSGVNLDEEAAKMIQYQQAYQAAAKFVSTVQSLFDAVLRLGG